MESRPLRYSILLFFTVLNLINAQSYEGDACYHNKKNKPGTCKLISKCQEAITDLQQSHIFPQNCGFTSTNEVIVCCPNPVTITTTTTTKKPIIKSRRSVQKCQEYGELAYRVSNRPSLLPGEIKEKEKFCPWNPDATPVIIDGDPAINGEFPHMALLGFTTDAGKIEWECGGSLISENFVLTAAHCLYSRAYGAPTTVLLGALNYTNRAATPSVQQISIEKTYEHPDYNPPEAYNDIALLKLAKPAKLDIYVKPICLYPNNDNLNSGAIVTGWGNTEYGGTKSDHLLKATLSVFPYDRCNRTFRTETRALPRGIDSRVQLCAGSVDSNKDTCQGDSGGPIQIKTKDVYCSYYIVGITSFGKQCGFQNVPAVYAKVYPHLEWIENIVWP